MSMITEHPIGANELSALEPNDGLRKLMNEMDMSLNKRNRLDSQQLKVYPKYRGKKMRPISGTIEELRTKLPRFKQEPASPEVIKYSFKNRETRWNTITVDYPGALEIERGEPVAVVSEQYQIMPHHKILDYFQEAFYTQHCLTYERFQEPIFQGWISFDGTRVLLKTEQLGISQQQLKDGHIIQPQAIFINSVDTSNSLTYEAGWFRQICSNGMYDFDRGAVYRHKHIGAKFEQGLIDSIKHIPDIITNSLAHYQSWEDIPIRLDMAETWARDVIAPQWGKRKAARFINIMKSGRDPINFLSTKDPDPCRWSADESLPVPGAAFPADNVYAFYQALTWLARNEKNLSDEIARNQEATSITQRFIDHYHSPRS